MQQILYQPFVIRMTGFLIDMDKITIIHIKVYSTEAFSLYWNYIRITGHIVEAINKKKKTLKT